MGTSEKTIVFSIASDDEEFPNEDHEEFPNEDHLSENDVCESLDDLESLVEVGYKRPSVASRMCAKMSRMFQRKRAYNEIAST